MFSKVEALDKQKHQELKFTPAASLDFAKEVTAVPLAMSEIPVASRYYPIIFPLAGAGMVPQALLSIKSGGNRYINSEGKWLVPYVPTHIRRYPFILADAKKDGAADADGNDYVVCIDRDAENFKLDEGTPLFDEQGEPGELVTKAIEMLQKFQGDLKVSERMVSELDEKDCLITKQLGVEVDGEKQAMGSFRVADLKKINQLDDATLAQWVRMGLMGLIYAQNMSLANLERLRPPVVK